MANRFLSNIKINDAYTFPASDGTNGQVIKTDGSGNLSFAQLAADSASVMYKDTFTGNGSTTAFTLANALNDEVQSNVYIDGVYQSKSTYSVSGTTLTFSTAPASGHEIEVISTTGINSGPTAIYTDTFTANGSAAAFTLGQTVHDENQTIVFLNGVYQFKGTYALSGTTLTLDAAPANGVAIEVMSIGSAYSGGDILYDHDFTSAGLMTTNGSGVYSITANNSSNWNTAYGWGDHSAQSYATQSYVGTQIANLVDSSPSTLNTLNELAAALGDDPNFATTTANSIGTKMPLAGGTFTGNVSLIKNSSSTGSSTSPKILIYNEGSGDSALQLSVSGSIDYYLGVDNSDDKFKIGGSSWDSSPYLTINTSGNATFAGDSYVTGSSNSNVVISRDNMYIDAGQLYIGADDAATDDTFRQRTASGSYFIESRKSGTWTNRLQINTAGTLIAGQGATFAGTVTFHDHTTHPDQVGARFGTDSDTVFQHNGSHFFMDNFTGTTYIRNTGANSSGIIIRNGNVGDIEIDNEVAANIKFNTSNIERMRIGSNGYVGMGMDNNNNQRLALAQADANGSHIRMNNSRSGGGYFVMGVGDSGSTSSITPAGGLFFYNGATRMVIDSSGNVGIGTTSPQTTLDIKGAASALNAHFGQGTNNSSGVFGGISLGYSEAGNASYRKVGIVAKAIGDGAARQELHFLVDTNADGGSAGIADSKMMINTSGNVGIGTTSPSYKLQVSSKTRLYNVAIGGTDGGLYNVYSDSVVGFNNLHLGSQGSGAVYVNSALARPMYINPVGGDVGIGTTSPEQKLHVEGRGIFDSGGSSDILQIRNNNGGGVFGMTSNLFSLDLASTSNFRIRQGSTTPLYITSAGRVGIGKTNPQAALDISSSYSIQGNVRTYMYAGTATGQTNINLDITVGNEGGQGNVFKIEAGFAHYYAMNYNSIAEWWCTSRGTTVINTYILNASSTLGGAWSASKPSTTVLRITKSAGTYSGSGKYWVKVTYVPF